MANTTEEDLDDLFDDIDIPADIRDARYAAVKDYQKYANQGGYGEYTVIEEEGEVLKKTAESPLCVVHFMHPDFRRCDIMTAHLKKLAQQHFRTRFYGFNADKGRWVSAKLKIRTLPAVLCFKDGVCKDRIQGFDELGNTDQFPTSVLEARLAQSGVIAGDGTVQAAASTKIFGFAGKKDDSDSDSD
eukprot:m.74030 g.74030  ORF g.74030 m.74030 type:complete len:187 (+) comp16139_c0_seq1:205-765(+)